jgi:hypothetical protein
MSATTILYFFFLSGGGPSPYTLLPHQELFYTCRAEVWRRTETRDSAGRPIGETWTPIAANVPCFLEHTASDKAFQQGLIYVEGDNIFTLDLWHFPKEAVWRATDWVKLTAAVDFWTEEPWDDVGAFWRLRGDPEPHQKYANKNVYRASREPPPEGIA